ncbi:uncharacterized protein LOC120089721 [Benincasa hispida]|uniref:uncharacterized protein LOC120089721 n=1 Tax=Benincasa hispida TaxID=102211 RepID=UPI0018FF64C3|nr:uncharacterized protein LOC120089721 [Benincasa hispida]XP_038903019.1 uncharacterized protein LOC120089721 [Benincasa hispida]
MRHSKDLLYLERKDLSSSSLESSLLVCKKNSTSKEPRRNEKPITEPASKSLVLGRVKDFLGVISEANKKLQMDAKDNAEKYDIEALDGNESKVIELDLMLGIADLHTPEAVAAAESAIIGNQPVIPLTCSSSSESESEESSDDSITSNDNNDDNEKSDDQNTDHSNRSSVKLKRSNSRKTSCRSKSKGKSKSEKRPKILELS